MIFLTYPHHGCVYTLSQEDGDELYYAPIYADGSVNMEEFAPVDMDSLDMDDMEIFDIRNRLVQLYQIGNWHSTPCGMIREGLFYICRLEFNLERHQDSCGNLRWFVYYLVGAFKIKECLGCNLQACYKPVDGFKHQRS